MAEEFDNARNRLFRFLKGIDDERNAKAEREIALMKARTQQAQDERGLVGADLLAYKLKKILDRLKSLGVK
jgi:hypothetical protein